MSAPLILSRRCTSWCFAALAFYNTAIYLGRGLIYMVANAARQKLAGVEAAAGALTAALPTATTSPEAIDAAAKQLILRDASGNV